MHFRKSHVSCQQVGCARKKTSVSHSSTETEIISLDAGLRLDGIPALDLWNWVTEVFHCNQNQPCETKDSSAQGNLWHRVMSSTRKKHQTKVLTKRDSSELLHIDRVPSNAKFSQPTATLHVFEDNEAVIKMIIKGKSPTMRHVSRTHRVSLDWLFGRKLGPQDSDQVHRHQAPDRTHIDKRTLHT